MPQLPPELPEAVPAAVTSAFRAHPDLTKICGTPLRASAGQGLSNRVFELQAEQGAFFLRLPLEDQAVRVDRAAEAHNLALAARLGLAVPPLYCDVEDAILLTRAVDVADVAPSRLPEQLGAALGKLHASGVSFQGRLDPDVVHRDQVSRLLRGEALTVDWQGLAEAMAALGQEAEQQNETLVPSHGDASPGNCLAAADGFWLIDWEFSAMAPPAWDLAYAILEHGFDDAAEALLLESYCAVGAGRLCPDARALEVMKARCDAISAFWALEQLVAGREDAVFRPFAGVRRDRSLSRLNRLQLGS